jgi:carbonic anhydrase/acetyltransferase-like protein (isoleucine patch superfamily)
VAIRDFNGQRPRFGSRVYADETAVLIGDIVAGDDVSFWPQSVVRGDVARIEIGNGSNVQDGCMIHGSHKGPYTAEGFIVSLGEGVTVGHHAVLHGCTLGNYCLVGTASVIMDGVVIEDRVMLGAGSLVPPGKRLQEGFLYVGSPVRKFRPLSETELEMLEYSAQHYMVLKDQYLG